MRYEAVDMKGRLREKVCVVPTRGDGFPLPFIFYLPTQHISSHTPLCTHTKAFTHALTNTNCSHLSVIRTDMFTLLLIWMSLHCLASFAILKTPLLSLSKLQADGDESAWLSPRSCESCFLPSRFILETITSYSSLCTERMSLIYSVTHLCEGARFFTASHHISSLSQGWYFCVNVRSQTHYK